MQELLFSQVVVNIKKTYNTQQYLLQDSVLIYDTYL